ncbi:hypothetical protein D3C78_1925990 [compost metagenome]
MGFVWRVLHRQDQLPERMLTDGFNTPLQQAYTPAQVVEQGRQLWLAEHRQFQHYGAVAARRVGLEAGLQCGG